MRLDFKRKIDTTIGLPALYLLGIFARILGFVLQRDHSKKPIRKILVMKFQGMGSLLMAKAAIHKTKSTYPNAKIIFWGSKGTCEMAQLMPEFDEVICLDDRNFFVAFCSLGENFFKIWRLRIDWAFDLEVYSKISSILTTFTCARNRAGFAIDSVATRKNIHTHLLMFNRYGYLADAYLRLFELINPVSNIQEQESAATKSAFGDFRQISSPLPNFPFQSYIVVNPHTGPLATERMWPKENFIQLCQALQKTYSDKKILIVGHGEQEIIFSQEIAKKSGTESVAGSLNLGQTIRLIANAACTISNDTAALHIAVVTNSPIVGLFGPTRAASYAPVWRKNAQFLYKGLYCSPCVHHWAPPPCGGNNQCMKQIDVDTVLRSIENIISNKDNIIRLEPSLNNNSRYHPGLLYVNSRKASG